MATFPTLDPLLWRPVAAGMWRQRELWDGTYDVQDLADVLEFLDTRDENHRRKDAYEASLPRGG